jgi:hypothetical protein
MPINQINPGRIHYTAEKICPAVEMQNLSFNIHRAKEGEQIVKQETRLYPPSFITLISGVSYITGNGETRTLHYTDDSEETGYYNPDKHGKEFLNIVSAIQAQRIKQEVK